MTAGTLYQTAVRHELRALRLRFTLRENGLCELADVPRDVLRAFSRRRVEIEAELARRGEWTHPRPGTLPGPAQVGWLTLTEHGLARLYGENA
jgi:hypothetical protein